MASEWEVVTLGSLGSLKNGANFNSKDYGEDHPVVSVKSLFRGRFAVTEDLDAIKAGVLSNIDNYLLRHNDILFARSSLKRSGSGQSAIVNHPPSGTIFSGFTIRFRVHSTSEVFPLFIFYSFQSPKSREQFARIATGTTISNLSQANLNSVEIALPSFQEQKAIAHILGSLDDKIELNRQMNETLEAMAQALFKSWFVDFDPVIDNALAAGNDIPDEFAERAELRKGIEKKDHSDTQNLFPDEFEFTDEMGWIPKGWEVKESGDLFDVRDGTHDSPKKSDEGKYLITSRHITSGVIDYPNAYLISQDDFDEVNKRSLVESYDILITMIGTVGVSMLVLQDEIDFAIKNVGLFKTSNNKSYAVFFYLYLNSNYMTQFLDSRLAGTTQKYLTLKVLRALPVVTPDNKTLSHFVNNMSPIFKKIHSNHEQIGILAKLRDTLLPKLMSGEIRIPDAEALVEYV